MQIASIDAGNGPTLGVRTDDGLLVDVAQLDSVPTGLRELLGQGPEALAAVGKSARGATQRLDPEQVTFLPLVPDPHAVWCTALNYSTHVAEGNWERPDWPPWFLRVGASLCGHEQPMVRPEVSTRLDYEGELAVVIGVRARHVPEVAVADVIAGYSCFNDGSVRDWQRHSKQITAGKNFSATGPFGPWLTTPDEVGDIGDATLTTRLNGTVMQQAKIKEMIFGIPQLVHYVSTLVELLPGDVIVSGTPGGVGARQHPEVFLTPGDQVEVEVDGVGVLRNPVVAETVTS